MNTRAHARQEAARRSWEGEFSYDDQNGVRCTISPSEAFIDGAMWQDAVSDAAVPTVPTTQVNAKSTITAADLRAHAKRLDERISRHGDTDACPECTDMRAGSQALTALAMIVDRLPGPRTFAENLSRDINGELFPRLMNADEVAGVIAASFLPTASTSTPVPAGSPPENCTCPTGDGSLRWPCPAHPPTTPRDTEATTS